MRYVCLVIFVLICSTASAVWLSYCVGDASTKESPAEYIYGVRFTPPASSGQISRVSVYLSSEGDPYDYLYGIKIYLFHVVNETPTTLITSTYYQIFTTTGWQTFNFSYSWSIGSETEFLIGVEPLVGYMGLQAGASYLWMYPQINPPNRNWQKPTYYGSWEPCTGGGDFMIRTEICCVGVDASSVGRIKSLFK